MTDIEIAVTNWMFGDDTGLSSMFMARMFMFSGREKKNVTHPHYPYDPSDFGRCHRLLEAAPALRTRLSELKGNSPVWDRYIDHWDELTTLYLEELPNGTAPKLYDRMKQLQNA